MAAKIKLQRIGAKNRPFYRIVVQDESSASQSRVIEILGQYHPLQDKDKFTVDKEKALAWVKKGAKPTGKVRVLLGKAGVLTPIDLAALPKRKTKGESPAEPPAPAEAVPAEAATAGKEEPK
jgi:small subunit ribosomal protein S16